MVLHYEAASFHLPSVITANINTMQYPKPCKQVEMQMIPAALIFKVLLHQSNIMAAFFIATAVYSLMTLQVYQQT
jgi:hypothetical protein